MISLTLLDMKHLQVGDIVRHITSSNIAFDYVITNITPHTYSRYDRHRYEGKFFVDSKPYSRKIILHISDNLRAWSIVKKVQQHATKCVFSQLQEIINSCSAH